MTVRKVVEVRTRPRRTSAGPPRPRRSHSPMLVDQPVDTTPAGSLRLADGTDYVVVAVELGNSGNVKRPETRWSS